MMVTCSCSYLYCFESLEVASVWPLQHLTDHVGHHSALLLYFLHKRQAQTITTLSQTIVNTWPATPTYGRHLEPLSIETTPTVRQATVSTTYTAAVDKHIGTTASSQRHNSLCNDNGNSTHTCQALSSSPKSKKEGARWSKRQRTPATRLSQRQ